MVVLVPLFYQLCILPGDLRIKHARPLFASEIRQQLCGCFTCTKKGQGTSGKPSVSHVIWASCMDHELANCGREAKPWHIQAVRLKSSSKWRAIMAEIGMLCLRFLPLSSMPPVNSGLNETRSEN